MHLSCVCLHIYNLRVLILENEIVKLKRMVIDNSKKKKQTRFHNCGFL